MKTVQSRLVSRCGLCGKTCNWSRSKKPIDMRGNYRFFAPDWHSSTMCSQKCDELDKELRRMVREFEEVTRKSLQV